MEGANTQAQLLCGEHWGSQYVQGLMDLHIPRWGLGLDLFRLAGREPFLLNMPPVSFLGDVVQWLHP